MILVAGRGGAFICDRCITASEQAVAQAQKEGQHVIRGGMYPFERFTGAGRDVLKLTQDEASAGRHAYIGTEHLLLALAKEPHGVGGVVIRSFGLDYDQAAAHFEKVLPSGNSEGDPVPTSRLREVIGLAFEEAEAKDSAQVGSGTLLVALLREGQGLGAELLQERGLDLTRVRDALADQEDK